MLLPLLGSLNGGLHADEGFLLILEKNWSLQTGWHLESCTRPSDASGTISVHILNNNYNADATLSPMGDALENGDTSAHLHLSLCMALIMCHLFLTLFPLSVIQYQLVLLIDLLKPSHQLLVMSQLLLQIMEVLYTPHSDLQPFLDQQYSAKRRWLF